MGVAMIQLNYTHHTPNLTRGEQALWILGTLTYGALDITTTMYGLANGWREGNPAWAFLNTATLPEAIILSVLGKTLFITAAFILTHQLTKLNTPEAEYLHYIIGTMFLIAGLFFGGGNLALLITT